MVAVKVLPAHVAHDPDVRDRFEREARMLAALSHPHICPVFDVGRQESSDGSGPPIDYLVMEFLEGETLADRLARLAGSKDPGLRIEEVLHLGIQIADALDKAHRKGIVHRDLKPGNIMLTKAGAKLLDFGLAKALPVEGAVGGLSIAATVTRPLTGHGTLLGSLHYMAPEQVEGKEADARSDIFALGAVLHEMATGQKAFDGKSAASVIASILEREPPALSTLQPLTPRALGHLVKVCLAKDPDERWQTAGDVMRQLKWIANERPDAPVSSAQPALTATRERRAWIAGTALLALIAVGLAAWVLRARPQASEFRLDIVTPPANSGQSVAVSPDGKQIVFEALAEGRSQLWLRQLDAASARPLERTEGATLPCWSPDSSPSRSSQTAG
jgi:serine/threonine protein kinase